MPRSRTAAPSSGVSRAILYPRLAVYAVGCALALPSGAYASGYGPIGTFGSGKVGTAFGVAVDQSSGDPYVTSFSAGDGVNKFDATGNLLAPPSPFDTEPGAEAAELSGVAVDPVGGNIDVVDAKHETIQRLSPSGSVVSEIAVPESATCIFFCVLGKATLTEIATDAAGQIYFPNPTKNVIEQFSPVGAREGTIEGEATGPFSKPRGVAVDGDGDIYVADTGNGRVVRIEHGTGAQTVLHGEGAKTVAVDPSNNDVFVGEFNGDDPCEPEPSPCFHVVEYDSSGVKLDDFGAGMLGDGGLPGPNGEVEPSSNVIATDPTTHDVYVTDGFHGEVWLFSQVTPPSATIEAPSEVTPSTALLRGRVNPRENETTFHFEYVDGADYDPAASDPYAVAPGLPASVAGTLPIPDAVVGAGTNDVTVEQGVSGLEANTTYHVRVVATTRSGETVDSADEEFTTGTARPFLLMDAVTASDVTQSDVVFNASINPQHMDTTYYFNYSAVALDDQNTCVPSPTEPYASVPTTPVALGTGHTVAEEAVGLTESLNLDSASVVLHPGLESRALQPNTVYHFQVVAANSAGTSCQPEATFITLPPDPTADTGDASAITQTTANLVGVVVPGSAGPDSDTTWRFQYGTDTSYRLGSIPATAGDAGMGTSPVPVATALQELAPNTMYHYRLVASNSNADPDAAPAVAPQFADGADHTFTTLPSEPLIGQPSGMSDNAVNLNGDVDPTGHDVHYRFDYGTTTAYGQTTPPTDAGEGAAFTPVSARLPGLTPGDTYHYRLVAIGTGGQSGSTDSTFTLYPPVAAQTGNPFRPGLSAPSPLVALPVLSTPAFPTYPFGAPQLKRAPKRCVRNRRRSRGPCPRPRRPRTHK